MAEVDEGEAEVGRLGLAHGTTHELSGLDKARVGMHCEDERRREERASEGAEVAEEEESEVLGGGGE